jgi:hypothetical protein
MNVFVELSIGTDGSGRYRVVCGTSGCFGEARDTYWFFGCPPGQEWNEETKTCEGNPCSVDDPPLADTAGMVAAPGNNPDECPIKTCQNGCEYLHNGDPVVRYFVIDQIAHCRVGGWEPTGRQCTASPETPTPAEPPTDSDGDGTSDGNDGNPNNPGSNGSNQGQDESRACGGEGQPECAEDGSNAGSGNGNTSGGGGNCQTPPTSTGDAILAQIAFQTWATRCALEGNANEGKPDGTPGPGNDDQPDWTKGNMPALPDTGDVAPEDVSRFGIRYGPELLDQEAIFGSGSCPMIPPLTIMGVTVSLADFPAWCDFVRILRMCILIFGAVTALRILLGG